MVTAGANQAFVNLVLTLTDESDKVVLFKPYYFNHLMALQMTGGADKVLLGPCDSSTLHPDLGWLQEQLERPDPPKMVVIVNPCNPTGEVAGFWVVGTLFGWLEVLLLVNSYCHIGVLRSGIL
eukprot:GHUV01028173.1.p1 GENE.GHUV01028173.1~~GHUV01028173.1.p1  ORF type:complete len:123 (-),score=19.62 GHUV01028173.1:217-585(-)